MGLESASLTAPFEDICVSIPLEYPTYPTPPQLQLLSRYISSFSVDAELFGAITRTFLLASSGPGGALRYLAVGEVFVFDGIESARAVATAWYIDRMSEAEAG